MGDAGRPADGRERTARRRGAFGRAEVRWVALALALTAPWAARAATLTAAQTISGAPAGAHAYLIHYRSVGYDGRANVLTGLLVEPDARAPDDGRPVVAWAHGTTGIAEGCAPSSAEAVRFAQIPALSAMIAHGWTIVAPDYAGLGSPGPHPYLVADATARAVLDSVRAARDHAPRATSARFALWACRRAAMPRLSAPNARAPMRLTSRLWEPRRPHRRPISRRTSARAANLPRAAC